MMKLIKILLLALLCVPINAAAQDRPNDKFSRVFINRIRTYAERGAWQEAKREINAGLELYPNDPDLRYYNGRYYYIIGNLNEARYNLVRSTQEDDQHFSSRRLLVDVEDTLHHYSSAICYINELLEFQPYDRDLWRRKIGLYRKLGNHVEADNALERLAHIYPNDTLVQRERRQRNRETWNQVLQRSTTSEAAENLEQWLELDPKNEEYYYDLIDIYRKMGLYDRALGTANRGLYYLPRNAGLIRRGIGILTAMGLHIQALAFAKEHGASKQVYNGLLQEVAARSRQADPYEATGRLYAATHDHEALTYLINTSLTRGYEDDARTYIAEAIRLEGRTPRRVMQLYTIEKRAGNEHAMLRLLEELATMEPIDEDIVTTYADMMMTLSARDMQTGQWADACAHLARALGLLQPEDEAWGTAVARQITILGHLRRYDDARDFYRQHISLTDSVELRNRFASAYEDIAASHLRTLIEEQQYEQALTEAELLVSIVPESEAGLRCCINMSQTLRRDALFQTYAKQGFESYPQNPYFINKYALALQQQRREFDALVLLKPRHSDDEWVTPQLVAAHSGISHEWANELMRLRMPDLALEVVDSALLYDPKNKELLYDRGVACERMKRWKEAYEYQSRYYEPSNAEQLEYYQHMRYLGFQSLRNRVDATYTHALYDSRAGNLASIAHLYSTATVAYSRRGNKDSFTGQVSYKGIDGTHYTEEDSGKQTEQHEAGGVGLEFMGQWEHTFNHAWSGMACLAWSTRYFNKVSANVQASYALRHGWTTSLRLGYRRTPETYLFLSSDATTQAEHDKYHLLLLTPAIEKSWERIRLSGSLDLMLMRSSIYYNVGLKGKLFFNDDNTSSISLITGFGSFPELTFFEQTALSGISHTNAMVGFDFQYLLTRHLALGLSGNWNTCYNPFRNADGSLSDSYRNIFTLNAQVHVAF